MPHTYVIEPLTCKQLADILMQTPDKIVVLDDPSLVLTAYAHLRIHWAKHNTLGDVVMLGPNNPSLTALRNVHDVVGRHYLNPHLGVQK